MSNPTLVIKDRLKGIKLVKGLNRGALLEAIARVESLSGKYRLCGRYESSYGRGGRYYNESLHSLYGDFAAMSYGTWQIMFPVAYELGYRSHPWLLTQDSQSITWVITYINKRAIDKGATSPEQIFDAYNTGNHKDNIIPHDYIQKALNHYHKCLYLYPVLKRNVADG
jgi:hypothetical protein